MNKDKPILLKDNEHATFAINAGIMKFNTKTIHGGQEYQKSKPGKSKDFPGLFFYWFYIKLMFFDSGI